MLQAILLTIGAWDCSLDGIFSKQRDERTAPAFHLLEREARQSNIARKALTFDARRDCIQFGMLPSEAVAVLAAATAARATHFLESGISQGQSTEFFLRYFTKSERALQYAGVDLDIRHELEHTRARLRKSYPQVDLVRGNASLFLPARLAALPGTARAAVMIDGPKGKDALQLGLSLLKQFPQTVAFVAIHDVFPGNFRAEFPAMVGNASLWTGDPAWRSAFAPIDETCNAALKRFHSFRGECSLSLLRRMGYGLAIIGGGSFISRVHE